MYCIIKEIILYGLDLLHELEVLYMSRTYVPFLSHDFTRKMPFFKTAPCPFENLARTLDQSYGPLNLENSAKCWFPDSSMNMPDPISFKLGHNLYNHNISAKFDYQPFCQK